MEGGLLERRERYCLSMMSVHISSRSDGDYHEPPVDWQKKLLLGRSGTGGVIDARLNLEASSGPCFPDHHQKGAPQPT